MTGCFGFFFYKNMRSKVNAMCCVVHIKNQVSRVQIFAAFSQKSVVRVVHIQGNLTKADMSAHFLFWFPSLTQHNSPRKVKFSSTCAPFPDSHNCNL